MVSTALFSDTPGGHITWNSPIDAGIAWGGADCR